MRLSLKQLIAWLYRMARYQWCYGIRGGRLYLFLRALKVCLFVFGYRLTHNLKRSPTRSQLSANQQKYREICYSKATSSKSGVELLEEITNRFQKLVLKSSNSRVLQRKTVQGMGSNSGESTNYFAVPDNSMARIPDISLFLSYISATPELIF